MIIITSLPKDIKVKCRRTSQGFGGFFYFMIAPKDLRIGNVVGYMSISNYQTFDKNKNPGCRGDVSFHTGIIQAVSLGSVIINENPVNVDLINGILLTPKLLLKYKFRTDFFYKLDIYEGKYDMYKVSDTGMHEEMEIELKYLHQ